MPSVHAYRNPLSAARLAAMAAMLAVMPALSPAQGGPAADHRACPGDDSGLILPPGFCATIFADEIGHARHLVVAPSGVVYVNTWSGVYYGNDTPHAGGFLVALQDRSGKGKADLNQRFGETVQSGGAGGTGIGFYHGALYAESNDKIVRYALPAGSILPRDPPQSIVTGLPLGGDHPMHPFAIDAAGLMYVDMGTATNSCQPENRSLESPGTNPCTELDTRGGIWRYDANKTDQKFSPAERFATGIRNAEGFAIDSAGRLFVTQHGRDQLHSNWPAIYALEQEATLPAEELLHVQQGGDYGWPECYFDPGLNKLVLAPEYGGDGKRTGECAHKTGAHRGFPGALGAGRHGALRQGAIPGPLPQRRIHRLSWLVESGALSAEGLQRGLSGAGRRQGVRKMRDFCRRLRGSREIARQGGASPHRDCGRARRVSLCLR